MPKKADIGGEPVEVLVTKDLEAVTESINKGFSRVLSELERSRQGAPSKETGSSPQLFTCKSGKCNFATQDIDAFVEHKIEEHAPKVTPLPTETRRGHATIREEVECPECRERIWAKLSERPDFPETLSKMGYVKAPPKEKEAEIV